MTVRELGQRMTRTEFMRWRARDRLRVEDINKTLKHGGVKPVIVLTASDIA